MVNRKTTIVIISLFLAIIAIFYSNELWNHHSETERTIGSHHSPDRNRMNDTPRPTKRAPREKQNSQTPSHSYGQLKNFMIPELVIEDMTFAEALQELRNQYYEICYQTGETPLRLKFNIKTRPTRTFSLTLRSKSLRGMLRTLNAVAGMKMERNNSSITFTKLNDDGHQYTKAVVTPPDITQALERGPRDNNQDPFDDDEGEKEVDLPAKTTISERLKELLGLPDLVIVYIPASGKLVIRANMTDINRIETVIDELGNDLTQVRIQSRIISIPKGVKHAPLPNLISLEDFRAIFQHINEVEGVNVITLPSTLARPHEKANIEVIKEINIPVSNKNDAIRFSKDWIGHKITHQPSIMGFGILARTTYNHGVINSPENRETSLVSHYKTETEKFANSHSNLIIVQPFKNSEGGNSYLLIQQEEIDASGNPIKR